MEDIQTQITDYMEENNISYTELAGRLGVSRQSVFKTLNGGNLSMKSALKITDALGLSLGVVKKTGVPKRKEYETA